MTAFPRHVFLPISYFGPISYYISKVQYPYYIEIHETYQKRTFRNRAKILSANGIQTISVPLMKGKTQKQIMDVEISYAEDWIANHLKSIRSAYGTAPYFEHYIDRLSDILKQKHRTLFELFESIETLLVKSSIIEERGSRTKTYQATIHSPDVDLRSGLNSAHLKPYEYAQVFEDKYGFTENLSILDLLFNLGPESYSFLRQCIITFDQKLV